MKVIVIAGWIFLLAFIVWEFIFANQLPEKYSRLKPRTIRLIDLAIAALILLSIWYLATV